MKNYSVVAFVFLAVSKFTESGLDVFFLEERVCVRVSDILFTVACIISAGVFEDFVEVGAVGPWCSAVGV